MKRLVMLMIVVQLTGCAAMEHQRIRSEQARQQAQLSIPEYGVDNRNHQAVDFAHGAAWWVGAEAARDALNRAIK